MADAVRNTHGGKAHLDTGARHDSRGILAALTVCGRDLERFEVVWWASTADEDRCRYCAQHATAPQPATVSTPTGDARRTPAGPVDDQTIRDTAAALMSTRWPHPTLGIDSDPHTHTHYDPWCALCRPDLDGGAERIVRRVLNLAGVEVGERA